jgi:hypothetical protein
MLLMQINTRLLKPIMQGAKTWTKNGRNEGAKTMFFLITWRNGHFHKPRKKLSYAQPLLS